MHGFRKKLVLKVKNKGWILEELASLVVVTYKGLGFFLGIFFVLSEYNILLVIPIVLWLMFDLSNDNEKTVKEILKKDEDNRRMI